MARESENVQKRRSLGRRTAQEADRDSCDLELALQRSFSHTGSRRSHRHSPYIQRNMKPDRQRHLNSNLHVLSPRGVDRGSPLEGLSLRKNDVSTEETEQAQCFSSDSAVNVRRDATASPNTRKSRSSLNTKTVSRYNASVALPEKSNASRQRGAESVSSLTGHYKRDSCLVKTPAERLLVPRGGTSSKSRIPKAEPSPADALFTSHILRPSPVCPTSIRTSLMTRFTAAQNELQHNAGARQKVNAPSDTGKLKGDAGEKLKQDEDKRLELNSESQTPLSTHRPAAAATAKTVSVCASLFKTLLLVGSESFGRVTSSTVFGCTFYL